MKIFFDNHFFIDDFLHTFKLVSFDRIISGSEYDEDEVGTDDEDSDDSWTTQEEFSSDIILRYSQRETQCAMSVFVKILTIGNP